MPFCFKKLANSKLVKTDPLSDTMMWGSPWVVDKLNNFSIVTAVVAFETGITSIHFECASIATKNILFKNGPA